MKQHKPTCWLVNTGWTGGPFSVGNRIEIAHSRALLRAAMSGRLDDVPMYKEPFFGLTVPTTCPGVPETILYPQKTWADPQAYERIARGSWRSASGIISLNTRLALSRRCWPQNRGKRLIVIARVGGIFRRNPRPSQIPPPSLVTKSPFERLVSCTKTRPVSTDLVDKKALVIGFLRHSSARAFLQESVNEPMQFFRRIASMALSYPLPPGVHE